MQRLVLRKLYKNEICIHEVGMGRGIGQNELSSKMSLVPKTPFYLKITLFLNIFLPPYPISHPYKDQPLCIFQVTRLVMDRNPKSRGETQPFCWPKPDFCYPIPIFVQVCKFSNNPKRNPNIFSTQTRILLSKSITRLDP